MDPNVPAVVGIVIVQVFHFDILCGCSQELESKESVRIASLTELVDLKPSSAGEKSIRREIPTTVNDLGLTWRTKSASPGIPSFPR